MIRKSNGNYIYLVDYFSSQEESTGAPGATAMDLGSLILLEETGEFREFAAARGSSSTLGPEP